MCVTGTEMSSPTPSLERYLQIQNNLIHGSYVNKIKKLIFLGSSCIYPKNSKLPIKEDYLSDVEAVQSGFISLSFLDYNLTADNQDDPLINILCK